MATKQSLYFPEEMLSEISSESSRLDRSLSWTVQQAWRLARAELQKLPAAAERPVADRAGDRARRDASAERTPSPQVLEFLKGKFDRDLVS